MPPRFPSLQRVAPAEFSALFRSIARASLAGGCLATGCAAEVAVPDLEDGGAEGGVEGDAEVAHDGSTPTEAGTDAGMLGDSSVGADAGTGEYVGLPCSPDHYLPKLPGPLNASAATDFLGVYARGGGGFEEPGPNPYYNEQASFGERPCATDDAPCVQAFDAVKNAAPCGDDNETTCPSIAVRASGATYTRLESRAELLALLGSIDSVAEAVLLAAFDGRAVRCPSTYLQPPLSGTATYTDASGVHVRSEWEDCGAGLFRESYVVAPDGTITDVITREKIGESGCAIGRRPAGLCAQGSGRVGNKAARFLAQSAELEAASVLAFQQLAHELSLLGAPETLIDGAHSALVDEVRHADVVSRLARAYGEAPCVPKVAASEPRSAFALALDNIGEGCVRETYGALLATYQASAAQDPEVRRAMERIAEDETRHAQLSWEIAGWLAPQLSDKERSAVHEAHAEAVRQLRSELDVGLDADERALLGLPGKAAATQLFAQLNDALWA